MMSENNGCLIEERILLRLYAAHSALFTFTTGPGLIRYLEKLLKTIPGVTDVDICFIDPNNPSQQKIVSKFLGEINLKDGKFNLDDFHKLCETLEEKKFQVYPLVTPMMFYGVIGIKVSEFEKFEPFDPVVNSFTISASTILENTFQQKMLAENNKELTAHRQHLTELIAAKTLSLNHAKQKLQNILDKTIESMALLTEERDPFTAGHQYRVASLSRAIAQKLELPAQKIHEIYLGALIHDIGKIHIPAEILVSPARLSKLEFELIKTHPDAGYQIANAVPFNRIITEIVLHHHERLDGSGYPSGLTDKEIPFATKIVTIADVFEAMSSHRPYRPKHSIRETLDELKEGAGKRYDLSAVKCCVTLITQEHFVLPPPPYLKELEKGARKYGWNEREG